MTLSSRTHGTAVLLTAHPGLTLDVGASLAARRHDPHLLEKTHTADSDPVEHLVDRPRRPEER
ncbi:hypothetical protein ND910_09060, partial [Schaalia meyeri]|uniref:hypothetical protein n=1 Tax=Schaalia meyeri TaxID=52773 RepID=UPI0020436D92